LSKAFDGFCRWFSHLINPTRMNFAYVLRGIFMSIKNCLAILLLALAPLAKAANLAWVSPNQVAPGETFLVALEVLPQNDVLGGIDLDLSYNTTAFTLNNVVFGAGLGQDGEAIHSWSPAGTGRVNLYSLSFLPSNILAQQQMPSASLFELYFTAQAQQQGFFSFLASVNDAVSAEGNPMALGNINAQIQVVPLPAALGFFLLGAAGFFGFTRKRG
jgi:hypothetical protein